MKKYKILIKISIIILILIVVGTIIFAVALCDGKFQFYNSPPVYGIEAYWMTIKLVLYVVSSMIWPVYLLLIIVIIISKIQLKRGEKNE